MAASVGVTRRLLLVGWLLAFVWSGVADAQSIHYQRQADTAPQEKSIGGGYVTPPVQKPLPRRAWLQAGGLRNNSSRRMR